MLGLRKWWGNRYSERGRSHPEEVARWVSTTAFFITLFSPIAVFVLGYELERRGHLQTFLMGSRYTTTALFLAVEGIIFGAYGLLEGHIQRRNAGRRWQQHQRYMEGLARQMSTRFIGPFPKHINEIIEVAEKADRELLIMADCIDYGSFAKPEAHERLLAAIEKALEKKVPVHILVCGEPAPISRSSRLEKLAWDFLIDTDEFKHYFHDIWRGKMEPKSREELNTELLRSQQADARMLHGIGAAIRRLPKEWAGEVRLFLWMEDGEDAVFLFSGSGTGTEGLAFRTRDSKLLEVIKDTFNQNWNNPNATEELWVGWSWREVSPREAESAKG